jgi:hypothetical protein
MRLWPWLRNASHRKNHGKNHGYPFRDAINTSIWTQKIRVISDDFDDPGGSEASK